MRIIIIQLYRITVSDSQHIGKLVVYHRLTPAGVLQLLSIFPEIHSLHDITVVRYHQTARFRDFAVLYICRSLLQHSGACQRIGIFTLETGLVIIARRIERHRDMIFFYLRELMIRYTGYRVVYTEPCQHQRSTASDPQDHHYHPLFVSEYVPCRHLVQEAETLPYKPCTLQQYALS